MAPISLLAFAFSYVSLTFAIPHGDWGRGNPWNHWQGRDPTPTLPLSVVDNTGASPLPSPSKPVKFIELGLGFQNYSCNASPSTPTGTYVQSVPSSGAIASFYDITELVTKHTGDTISENTLRSFEICLQVTGCEPTTANSFCETCHRIAAAPYQRKFTGRHFFAPINGAQTPNFDLAADGDFLSAKKAGDDKAPASAYDGANRLGAVDWLYLVDNGNGLTHGLASVYRVETAGGVAPASCTTPGGLLQIPYAAEYWFYD